MLLIISIVLAIVPLLGGYMARVYTGERVFLTPVLAPVERLTYRLLRVDAAQGQVGRVGRRLGVWRRGR